MNTRLQDVEAGRAVELEALLGSVIELGRITDKATPTLQTVYHLVSLLSKTLAHEGARLLPQPTET